MVSYAATVYGIEDYRSAAARFGRANMEALGLLWDFTTLREHADLGSPGQLDTPK